MSLTDTAEMLASQVKDMAEELVKKARRLDELVAAEAAKREGDKK